MRRKLAGVIQGEVYPVLNAIAGNAEQNAKRHEVVVTIASEDVVDLCRVVPFMFMVNFVVS